jgi:Coenzyme PQQ synthesis protein D (PqqD)
MITNIRISYNTAVKQNPANMVSDMDGEKVILSIENGKYYSLGTMGSVIWTQIDQPKTMNNIINYLLGEYEISLEDCSKQVSEFLEHLLTEELIQIINSSSNSKS